MPLKSEIVGLPIEIELDEIKSGGLLNSKIDPCLVIRNTEHPRDYFAWVLPFKSQRGECCCGILESWQQQAIPERNQRRQSWSWWYGQKCGLRLKRQVAGGAELL